MNKNKSFFLFHLNLAFSSIEYDQHIEVINKCYFPLLKIFSEQKIKFAIELSGWTLNRILEVSPEWIALLKKLIEKEQVEIVGSGYSQIIGPLVPYEVNIKNHEIGLNEYKRILGISPKTVLVNEMVFSNDMAEIYQDVGYENMIMDGDNLSLSLRIEKSKFFHTKFGAGKKNRKLIKLLPTDSIIFQKFQRVAHSEIGIEEYIDYLSKILSNTKNIVTPIYCNDAEIFNFRPGRFDEEAQIETDEWENIQKILLLIKNLDTHQIEFPKDICNSWKDSELEHLYIKNLSYPVPVKKQKKYNLARWSVTGRNDNKINAICYSIYKKLKETENSGNDDWMDLIFLWSSDFRTHITTKRWEKYINIINNHKKALNPLKKNRKSVYASDGLNEITESVVEDDIFLHIKTEKIFLILNKNKGLSIHSAGVIKHKKQIDLIGTIEHGFFDNIELGADFFCGSLVIQDMQTSKLYTDLQKVNPKIDSCDKYINIHTDVNIGNKNITKCIRVDKNNSKITVEYKLSELKRCRETVRLCAATIKTSNMLDIDFKASVKSGGKSYHTYNLDNAFDHGAPVSHRISSTAALPATNGKIKINVNRFTFEVIWDPSKSFFYPLFSNMMDIKGSLIRLHLSAQEVDDTLKSEGNFQDLKYSINLN